MTQDQVAIFVTKATKQYVIAGRNQVEGMTVALASLFKSEAMTKYMEETDRVIESLDDPSVMKAPTRNREKQKTDAYQSKVNRSMQNLGQLTALFQGTWQPPS